MPSLKRETALWLLLFLGVVAARTLGLGFTPLGDAEAAPALVALSISRGDWSAYANPLLAAMQALPFSLIGASDTLARLPGALAGVALVGSPWWARSSLGRARALLFAALLAISPTAWLASRSADGGILGWSIALTMLMLWLGRRPRMQPVLAGLLLATGRDAILPSFFVLIALVSTGGLRGFMEAWRARASGAITGLVFLAGATAIFLNPPGLGAAFNGLAQFAAQLTAGEGLSFTRLSIGMVASEFPLFVLGITGAVMATLSARGSHAERPWLAWAGLGILITLAPGLRGANGALGLVIGLAALGSTALDRLLARTAADLRYGAGMILVSSMGLCTLVLLFAFASSIQFTAQGVLGWLLAAAVAGLAIVGICLMMAVGAEVGVPFRGALLALTACGCVYLLGTGYNMAVLRANNPAEPYVPVAADDDLARLQHGIAGIGTRAFGDPSALAVTVDASAPPSLRWVLREQRLVTYTALPASDNALLLPTGLAPPAGASYVGEAYAVATSASLRGVTCRQIGDRPDCSPIIRWLLRRQVDNLRSTQWVLWLRSDTSALVAGRR